VHSLLRDTVLGAVPAAAALAAATGALQTALAGGGGAALSGGDPLDLVLEQALRVLIERALSPARFAADLDWLRSQGHQVDRFNLAQQPAEFAKNREIHQLLTTQGTECLPVVVVDGHVVSQRGYPSREMLTLWTGVAEPPATLPVVDPAGGCCGGSQSC
jgi:7-keto-8-aminopelargonate synthetase-like enzyme